MKKIISFIITLFTILFLGNNIQAREISDVPHWQTSPIKVYVPQDDKKAPSMRRAFARWQAQSYGKLKFRFVAKGPADIDVVFCEKASGASPISSTSITINGSKITKAEINIATKDPNFKKYSNDFVFTAMLHEIGSAIGMPTNDRKRTSIMFAPIKVNQDIMKFDIMKLYSIYGWSYANKDIKNTDVKPTEEKVKPAENTKQTTTQKTETSDGNITKEEKTTNPKSKTSNEDITIKEEATINSNTQNYDKKPQGTQSQKPDLDKISK